MIDEQLERIILGFEKKDLSQGRFPAGYSLDTINNYSAIDSSGFRVINPTGFSFSFDSCAIEEKNSEIIIEDTNEYFRGNFTYFDQDESPYGFFTINNCFYKQNDSLVEYRSSLGIDSFPNTVHKRIMDKIEDINVCEYYKVWFNSQRTLS